MTRYSLSADARIDLQGIREYFAPATQSIQLRILNELESCFLRLCDFPIIGRAEPELNSRYGEHTRSIWLNPIASFTFPSGFR